ncbi:R3H and coiled-coil domain-containing protein 1-like [Zingiber officinale]|uniref:R3H and coiled-coil domain-containing protein 1-like n=1 Tax=Zingiber officinale TaxID=94328 RepID=UPI001C4AA581|nr:R3H and coiled-coil domain-containing protein 1-like [Zingiber officinale]
MEAGGSSGGDGWSEAVEDLVERGDIEGAISVLESVVSRLQSEEPSSPSGDLRLATALEDLAEIHSSRGFSLKADEIRSRALAVRTRGSIAPLTSRQEESGSASEKVSLQEEIRVSASRGDQEDAGDDWEAIADRGYPDESFLSSNNRSDGKSSPPKVDAEVHITPKRRGRGSFMYEKSYLYSEQLDSATATDDRSQSDVSLLIKDREHRVEDDACLVRNFGYGTDHVLVLYNFPPSTQTIELEKLFEKFKDDGVAIRWVNDTVALAVFRTPTLARDAHSKIPFLFKVRFLQEDDSLRDQISAKDLEPPYPRPKTSARTAQRLIAQGMGIKPSTEFRSDDLRKQEEARKNRIVARKSLRDDAWGSDDP